MKQDLSQYPTVALRDYIRPMIERGIPEADVVAELTNGGVSPDLAHEIYAEAHLKFQEQEVVATKEENKQNVLDLLIGPFFFLLGLGLLLFVGGFWFYFMLMGFGIFKFIGGLASLMKSRK